uniref:Abnormal spindle-like microcephaly-associated protein ASH domain-containing protein n=1 Tax=Electrophorus electricus TaxID=8005 RepID=A0A4W4DUM2_ELEEL
MFQERRHDIILYNNEDEDGPLKASSLKSTKMGLTQNLASKPAKIPTAGKELKHPPFVSKPEIVLFKDFDLGRTYKKKVVLTNVCHTTNYCRFLGVSQNLFDFLSVSVCIEIQFPYCLQNILVLGILSTHVSFLLFLSFQLNEDLDGRIQFQSANGPFYVIVKCRRKRCEMVVDSSLIDFGTHVVGQTISRVISLTNRGALGTCYALSSLSSDCPQLHHLSQQQALYRIFLLSSSPQALEGEVGPFASVKLPVVFTPTLPGETRLDMVVSVRGVAESTPVWVAEPSVDLRICVYDHLYQDSIEVQTSTALRLTFEVCKELKNHMDILPKTGYIQAKSKFQAQLKFLPRRSLPGDAKSFFDQDTGVLEVPLAVQVADQAKPVWVTVHAVVTTSDLEFHHSEVDFGHCSVFESVKASVRLTNRSLLPQDFGFVGVPKFIDVQPNDGFGTLLPHQTLDIDLIFSASKAGEYNFQLTCKSGTNRDFLLACRAVGVRPSLELSASLVRFRATAVGDRSVAVLYVSNTRASRNELSRRGPRVGEGPAAPVVPRLFSFTPPENSGITVTPARGTGVLLFILPSSDDYAHGRASLLRSFKDHVSRYVVPCHVSDADIAQPKGSEVPTLLSSPYNTLYLELHCPAIRPKLVVISDSGRTTVNFSQVAVGNALLKSSLLDLNGPFSVLNVLRAVRPGDTHTLLLAFMPALAKKTAVELTLCGEGVAPLVTCSLEGQVTNFGHVLERESATQWFTLQNSSSLRVQFRVVLGSSRDHSPKRSCYAFMSASPAGEAVQTGTQNYNGQRVFSVSPTEGAIGPGKTQDIAVTFQPDHESRHYQDTLRVQLMNEQTVCVVELRGAARRHTVFVCGGDALDVCAESLLPRHIYNTGMAAPAGALSDLPAVS